MFSQCELVSTFCEDYIDSSTNIKIATDITDLACLINETLNRYFAPCFTHGDREYHRIGFVDIHPDNFDDRNQPPLKRTYSVFRGTYKLDLLEIPRLRIHLKDLVITKEG